MLTKDQHVHGCGERGHVDSWNERGRRGGQGEMDDSLWRLLEKPWCKREAKQTNSKWKSLPVCLSGLGLDQYYEAETFI